MHRPLDKELLTRIIREELDIFILEARKRKTKPNCSPGNVYHDSDGEFTDKSDAKSYSLKFMTGDDCKRGQARMPGQRFLKRPCGRRKKHGGGKEKYRCKDGSEIKEAESDWITGRKKMKPSLVKKKKYNELYPGHQELMTYAHGIYEQETDQNTQLPTDYSNCRLMDLSKDYSTDKKTGIRTVKLRKDFECDYTKPVIDKSQQAMLDKLHQQTAGIDSKDFVRVKKPAFDSFMKWLDTKPKLEK